MATFASVLNEIYVAQKEKPRHDKESVGCNVAQKARCFDLDLPLSEEVPDVQNSSEKHDGGYDQPTRVQKGANHFEGLFVCLRFACHIESNLKNGGRNDVGKDHHDEETSTVQEIGFWDLLLIDDEGHLEPDFVVLECEHPLSYCKARV